MHKIVSHSIHKSLKKESICRWVLSANWRIITVQRVHEFEWSQVIKWKWIWQFECARDICSILPNSQKERRKTQNLRRDLQFGMPAFSFLSKIPFSTYKLAGDDLRVRKVAKIASKWDISAVSNAQISDIQSIKSIQILKLTLFSELMGNFVWTSIHNVILHNLKKKFQPSLKNCLIWSDSKKVSIDSIH